MAEIEDIGSDMEEEYNFRKRVDEGLIKVRPPRDEEEDEDSFEKEDYQNLNPGNNKGDAEDGNENLKRKEDKEISTSTSSDTEEEPVKCPICKSEYAPLQKDRKNRRIGCDGCGEWYHFVCAGISKNNIPGKNENWYCRQCSRKNAGSAEWKPSTSEEKKLKIPSLRKQNSGTGEIRKSTRRTAGVQANKYSPGQYDVITEFQKKTGLEKKFLKLEKNLPASYIFCSKDYLTNEHLLILIHDRSIARVGNWSSNRSKGSQIPYIKTALKEGYAVIVLNYNTIQQERGVSGIRTPFNHCVSVWQQFVSQSLTREIFIVAHGNGSQLAIDMAHTFQNIFLRKVSGVFLIESNHRQLTGVKKVDSKLTRIACNYIVSERAVGEQLECSEWEIPKRSAGNNEATPSSVMESIFYLMKVSKLPVSDKETTESKKELNKEKCHLSAKETPPVSFEEPLSLLKEKILPISPEKEAIPSSPILRSKMRLRRNVKPAVSEVKILAEESLDVSNKEKLSIPKPADSLGKKPPVLTEEQPDSPNRLQESTPMVSPSDSPKEPSPVSAKEQIRVSVKEPSNISEKGPSITEEEPSAISAKQPCLLDHQASSPKNHSPPVSTDGTPVVPPPDFPKEPSPVSAKEQPSSEKESQRSSDLFWRNNSGKSPSIQSDRNIPFPILFDNCHLCQIFVAFCSYKKTFNEAINSYLDVNIQNFTLCDPCLTNTPEKLKLFLTSFENRMNENWTANNENIQLNIKKINTIINHCSSDQSHEIGVILINGISGFCDWSSDQWSCIASILSIYLENLLPASNGNSISKAMCVVGYCLTKSFFDFREQQSQIEVCEILWYLLKEVQVPHKLLFKGKFTDLKDFLVNLEPSLKFEQDVRLFVIKSNEKLKGLRNENLIIQNAEFSDLDAQPSKSMYGETPSIEIDYDQQCVTFIVTANQELKILKIPFQELTLQITTNQDRFILSFTSGHFIILKKDFLQCKRFLSFIPFEVIKSEENAQGNPGSSPCDQDTVDNEKRRQDSSNSSDEDQEFGPQEATIETEFVIKPENWSKYWKPSKHQSSRFIERTEAGMDFPRCYNNPCIVLIGTKNHVKLPSGKKRNIPWCNATGVCKICNSVHVYKIQDSPFGNDEDENFSSVTKDIHVSVKVTGSFFGYEPDVSKPNHHGKEPERRQLRGEERKLMSHIASKDGVNATFNAQMAYKRENEIEHDNYTTVRSQTQISQAKYELEKSLRGGETLYESVLIYKECSKADFSKTHDNLKMSKKFGGLIRQVVPEPFSVQYWTFDQLRLTIGYLNNKDREVPTVIHLDFTGNIFYDKDNLDKAILNGGIVIPPKVTGATPLIVAEWASVRNQTRDVKMILTNWVSELQIANNHVRVTPPQVVVIDISWNLIHAIIETIIQTNIKTYLKRTYDYLRKGEDKFPYSTVVTFCKNHSLPAWVKKARGIGPDKVVADTFIACCLLLANCETWNEVLILYVAIVNVFCSNFVNKDAHNVLNKASKKHLKIDLDSLSDENNYMDLCLDPYKEILSTLNDESTSAEMLYEDGSIRKESPFRSLFDGYRLNLMDREKDIEIKENKFYAPNLVLWFDQNWMPLAPFWLRCILPCEKNRNVMPLYTNSYVELYWKEEKSWYSGMSSSKMWPFRIFYLYSKKVGELIDVYRLLGKNPNVKKPKPRTPKTHLHEEPESHKTFQPSFTRGRGHGARRHNTRSRIGRIDESEGGKIFTPSKSPRKPKWTNEEEKSETKYSESWKRNRGTGSSIKPRNQRYFGRELKFEDIKFPEKKSTKVHFGNEIRKDKNGKDSFDESTTEKKSKSTINFGNKIRKDKNGNGSSDESTTQGGQKNKSISITGYDQNFLVRQEQFNWLIQSGPYIDTDVMEAGIGLLNKDLHSNKPEYIKIIPICILRLIWNMGQSTEARDLENLGEYGQYLNGKRSFATILPRRFEAYTEEGNLTDDACHYTLISSLFCEEKTLRVYETYPPFQTTDETVFTSQGWNVVTKLLGVQTGEYVKIILEDVEDQVENECGALSLALCDRLLFHGVTGPSQTAIDDCRSHLAECLRQNRMEEFPTRQRTQIGEPVEFNIFIDDDIIHNKEEDEKRKAAMMEREKRQQLINLI